MRIALVNCAVLPEPDPDEAPALHAFRAAGQDAHTLAWDDPAAEPGTFDLCLLRATWNYVTQLDAFLAWCERAHSVSRLINPPSIVRWNAHKGYLSELARAGVPIVPTRFVRLGESKTSEAWAWDDVVIKPATGAGSYLTKRFRAGEGGAARAFLSSHAHQRDMLVQQYMTSVEGDAGERALVWVDGEVTHAVEKSPRFAGEEESVRGRDATSEERAFAIDTVAKAAAIMGAQPLYARVDVMTDEQGRMVLSELELIEPSLYFDLGPGSVERFVEAVAACVRT